MPKDRARRLEQLREILSGGDLGYWMPPIGADRARSQVGRQICRRWDSLQHV